MRKAHETWAYAFLLHDFYMNFPISTKNVRRFCNRIYAETPHAVGKIIVISDENFK